MILITKILEFFKIYKKDKPFVHSVETYQQESLEYLERLFNAWPASNTPFEKFNSQAVETAVTFITGKQDESP